MTLSHQFQHDFQVAFGALQVKVSHLQTADRLMSLGEEGRAGRSAKKPVKVASFELLDEEHRSGITGQVQGVTDLYDVRILVIGPSTEGSQRAYHCSCEDSKRRGRWVGPCKHTLALTRVWRDELVRELTRVADRLGPMMPDTWRQHLPQPPQGPQLVLGFQESS